MRAETRTITSAGSAAHEVSWPAPPRLVGLDFAKGMLVLVMVVYHWMNYFVVLETPFFKYLRFLTPSFIFLAGFIVSHVYLPRAQSGRTAVPRRLILRGSKLLTIVAVLNVAARILGTGMAGRRLGGHSVGRVVLDFITGSTPVAFSVLVPIAYLLVICAWLLALARYRLGLYIVSATFVAAALISAQIGVENGYLEMLGAGMLGVSLGTLDAARLQRLLDRPVLVVVAYGAYLSAIAAWNAVYIVLLFGVIANTALFYVAGRNGDKDWRRIILRLGNYSLFAYIAQIIILQVARKVLAADYGGAGALGAALAISIGTTVLAVEVLDQLNRRVPRVKRLYETVFA